MKNTTAICIDETSLIVAELPTRVGSIMAGVLVHLTENTKPMTIWDGVDLFQTVYLASAIRSLQNNYGWPIEHVEFPILTPNREFVAWTAGYILPSTAISAAYKDPNFRNWVRKVKTDQYRTRERKAAEVAAINAYRFGTDPFMVDATNRFMTTYLV